MKVDCAMILCDFQAVLASVDIGNENIPHYRKMFLTEKAEMLLLTPLSEVMFLSFMSSYILDEHKCRNT